MTPLDPIRIAVLIWIAAPIPVYLISRLRHMLWMRRYPAAATGTIVSSARQVGVWRDYDGSSFTYEYTNAKCEFEAGGTNHKIDIAIAGEHTVGEQIRLRYDPAHPEAAQRDRHPTPAGWAVMGLLCLAFDLGTVVFFMATALISLAALAYGVRRRPPWYRTYEQLIGWGLLGSLIILAIFAPYAPRLIAGGFWGQNLLWRLWNHQLTF